MLSGSSLGALRELVAVAGIYPADTSRKDPDSQTAHQHAAVAISPNAQPHSSEAPLFVIVHSRVAPPTKAQLLLEQHLENKKAHQLFLDCLLPNWHKDPFIPERLLKDYSNEPHLSAVATAIGFLKTLQEIDSQFDHDESDTDDDYGHVQNPTKARNVSNNFLNVLPGCPTIHWPTQMFIDPPICFCTCSTNTKPWREKNESITLS
jgi:hypothetical protein